MKLLIPTAIFPLLYQNIILSTLISNYLACVSVEVCMAVYVVYYQDKNVLEKPVTSVFRLVNAAMKMGIAG
jgi:hypothetical protein